MRPLIILCALSVGCAKSSPPEAPAAEETTPSPEPAPNPTEEAPVLDPVHFATGSAEIEGDEMYVIDRAANILESDDWSLMILGMADASGDAASNRQLSKERAAAVARAIRARVDVPRERILVHALGERLATTTTITERKVELIFYRDQGLPPREVVIQSGVLADDYRKKHGP